MSNLLSPNDFGKNNLVENLQKIEINDLIRRVAPVIKRKLIQLELDSLGSGVKLTTSKSRFGGERIWFICPLCTGRRGTLFQHPNKNLIGCRKCLNLDYRAHRYSKMVEVQM